MAAFVAWSLTQKPDPDPEPLTLGPRNKYSRGLLGYPPALCKALTSALCKPLSEIFSLSLLTGSRRFLSAFDVAKARYLQSLNVSEI